MNSYQELIQACEECLGPCYGNKSKTVEFTEELISHFIQYMDWPHDRFNTEHCFESDSERGFHCTIMLTMPGGKLGEVELELTLHVKPNDMPDEGGYVIWIGSVHAIVEDTEPKKSRSISETCSWMKRLLLEQIYKLPREASPVS